MAPPVPAAAAALRSPPAWLARPERRAELARWLMLAAGGCAAGYAAYWLYHSDGVAAARQRLARLRAALAAYADAFGTGADTLRLLAADLHAFLESDRQRVPASLRQLARLMQSPEVADTTSATVAALLRGIAASHGSSEVGWAGRDGAAGGSLQHSSGTNGSSNGSAARGGGKGALDRILDALLSERGTGLVSVAVSLGARNLVTAWCEAQHRLVAADRAAAAAGAAAAGAAPPAQPPDLTNRLLDFLASPSGQRLAVLGVTAFVSGGMRQYLDQTLDINFYEDLFAAMAKPEHLEAVKQCVGVFARDVVGAYLAGPPQQAGTQPEEAVVASAPGVQLRLSASIQELLGGGRHRQQGQQQERQQEQQQQEAQAEPGSPCGSSASGAWQAAAAAAAASDVDSDVLLHPEAAAAAAAAKGASAGDGSARSQDGGWAVCTPVAATEAARAGAAAPDRPVLPQLRRVQEQAAAPAGMQREGSGNLEWISAVSKEWLNVAQHPQGRTVMVQLAGTAAKEAAAGVSAALADRFRLEWMLLAALAMLLLAWLAQRLLGVLLG